MNLNFKFDIRIP